MKHVHVNLLANDELRGKIRNIIEEFEKDRAQLIEMLCDARYDKTCSHEEKTFMVFGREFEVSLAMQEALVETVLYRFDFTIREIIRNPNGDIEKKADVKLNYDYFYTLNHQFRRTDSHESYTIEDVVKSFRKWYEMNMQKSYIA
jgi:hypothetical protein